MWTDDAFLDAEQGINNGIRKIRVALGDNFENPKYIETVVGRGYRFKGEIRAEPNVIIGRNGVQVAPENGQHTAAPEYIPQPSASSNLELMPAPPRRWWTPVRHRI